MVEEVLSRDEFSPLYWVYLSNHLIPKSLVNIAKKGKNIQEEIDIIMFYCDKKLPPPPSKLVNIESLVESMAKDLTSIVKEVYTENEIKTFEEEMKKIVEGIRGEILQFSKTRYTPEVVPVIIRPILAFLRSYSLSALDETIRETSKIQTEKFSREILKRCGIEPEKEEKDKKTVVEE